MHLDLQTIRSQVAAGGGLGAGGHLRRRSNLSAGPSDVLYPAPRITAALRFGTPQRRNFLGDALMPNFPRDAWKVLVISEDDSHLKVYDTERALQEPRKRGKYIQSTSEFEMASFGLEYGVDRRLVTRVADAAFRLAVGSARRAQWGVRLDLENRKALLLSTPGNYAAADRSDESGTPWNGVGGDALASFEAAYARLKINHPGYTETDFSVGLSEDAWFALRNDTTWRADRITAGNGPLTIPSGPDGVRLAEAYLGLGEGSITVGDATVNVEGTVQSMWGETAIVYLATDPATLDTEFGSEVFALNHVMGGGNAFPPYFEDRPTTDWYPYEDLALPVVHNYTTAFLMYDMKA